MIESIVHKLNAQKFGNGWLARCPSHDDQNPSLSILLSEQGKLLVHCFAGCGQLDIISALKSKGCWPAQLIEPGDSQQHFQRIWSESQVLIPTTQNCGNIYLGGRGIKYNCESNTIRFHPNLRYRTSNGQTSFHPALVSQISIEGNQPIGILRTYLAADGQKAQVDTPKKSLGRISGGGIWIDPPGPQIAVAEGLETALAVRQATGLPTCAAVSAGNMKSLIIPRKVAEVHLFADRDSNRVGEESALAKANELLLRGVNVYVHVPPVSEHRSTQPRDWLDVLIEEGEEKIRSSLTAKPLCKEGDTDNVVCLADVNAEEVFYLWHPYLPQGKLSCLEGDPGLGKSFITLAIAAAVSTGNGLPFCEKLKPMNVLFLTGEDGIADTIKPRLLKLDADHSRVFCFTRPQILNDKGLDEIRKYIHKLTPGLVVIDPIASHIPSGKDINHSIDVRSVLTPLAAIAEQTRTAILIVRHLSKGSQSKGIYRGAGSIDITAACRSVMLVGKDPNDEENRAIIHIKHNLSEKGQALGYKIVEGKLEWTGASDLTLSQILASDHEPISDQSKLDEAKEFLLQALASGPVRATHIERDATNAGLSRRTIMRAKKELSIRSLAKAVEGRKGMKEWVWILPDQSEGGLDCQVPTLEMLATLTDEARYEEENQ